MTKRKQPEPDIETVFSNKPAESYSVDEAVDEFNLIFPSGNEGLWRIEMMPEVKKMEPSRCFQVLLHDYIEIYDRSSEAACRVAVDLLLCDLIAQMRGRAPQPTEPQPPGKEAIIHDDSATRPSTPTPWKKLRVFCEISFKHPISKGTAVNDPTVIVGGRVNYGVGVLFRPVGDPNRRFHSLLLCVESKVDGILVHALRELVVYLGALHQSRIKRGKRDSSVYGVTTDGLRYIFVTISHEGVLKQSDQFSVRLELPIVLGSLRYILEKAMAMSPNVFPMQGVVQSEELNNGVDVDEVLDVMDRDDQDDDGE